MPHEYKIGDCPKCGHHDVAVAYAVQRNGQGEEIARAAVGASCPNQKCEWFDPRAV